MINDDKYKTLYQQLLDYTQKLKKHLEKKILLSEQLGYNISSSEYESWMRLFYKMYSILTDMGGLIKEHNEDSDFERVYSEVVSAAVSKEGDLVVRLPRITKQKFLNSQFFVREILYALDSLKVNSGIPYMQDKLISVINIYGINHDKYKIADNMNWDTKKVIDYMVDYTGGGDGGLNAFCQLASFQTDEIDAGMYIIISPDKNKKFKNVIDFLRSVKF